MKRYKVHSKTTSCFFSSLTITDWVPVFQNDKYFDIIIDNLQYCRENKGLLLLGYVIMPTHLHVITMHNNKTTLSDLMRDFKSYTSKEISKQMSSDGKEWYLKKFKSAACPFSKQRYKVWQDGFHPISILSTKWFSEKVYYIHYNPVRKGFVENPEYWKYSSARNWLMDDNRVIEIDKIMII